MKTVSYRPIPGWFDLSNLDLPKEKFEAYRQLQILGEQYQQTIQYQKEHNRSEFDKLKELCAEMNIDLILNYDALKKASLKGKEKNK